MRTMHGFAACLAVASLISASKAQAQGAKKKNPTTSTQSSETGKTFFTAALKKIKIYYDNHEGTRDNEGNIIQYLRGSENARGAVKGVLTGNKLLLYGIYQSLPSRAMDTHLYGPGEVRTPENTICTFKAPQDVVEMFSEKDFGTCELTNAQIKDLKDGKLYVDVTVNANKVENGKLLDEEELAAEIRGPLVLKKD